MGANDKSNNNYLNVLKSLKHYSNPFLLYQSNNIFDNPGSYTFFEFPEDLYDFELKCLICFGRVSLVRRPENCYHIFCSLCLKEWMKQSDHCPYCRKEFHKIIKVNYSEPLVRKNLNK